MAYNVIRKHSEDQHESIIETTSTRAGAETIIKAEIAALKKLETPHKVQKLGGVTNIKFFGIVTTWSIGFWVEKV